MLFLDDHYLAVLKQAVDLLIINNKLITLEAVWLNLSLGLLPPSQI